MESLGVQVSQKYCRLYKDLLKKYGFELSGFYGYLLDMRSLSENTTTSSENNKSFIDEDGVYCVLSYEKITEDTNLTEHKIKKYKKQLTQMGLMKEKRQLTGGNKIYVYDVLANKQY
jgi:hypothetical protein